MRFLVDARPFAATNSGGVSRVAAALTSAMVTRATNDDVILATTGANSLTSSPSHIHLRIPNKLWSAACFAGIASLDHEIEKRAGKINAMFLPNVGWVGRVTRPYVLLLHDLSFLIEPKWFSAKQRLWHHAVGPKRLIKNANHLVAVSATTKRDAVRLLNIPPERITVIPIGTTLPIPSTTTHRQPPTSRIILAFTGDARKNVAGSIAAVERLRQDPEFSDVKLIVVGRDGLHPSDTELADLYANASCLLYPSWYEGYGLPLHEAAMFGTPCVASSAGALPETAPAGTIFADPTKPHHITEALRLTLNAPRSAPIIPDPAAWDRAADLILGILRSYA